MYYHHAIDSVIVRSPIGNDQYSVQYKVTALCIKVSIIHSVLFVFFLSNLEMSMFVIDSLKDNVKLRTRGEAL